MKVKEKGAELFKATKEKFALQFGFNIEDVSFDKIVDYMHQPKDSSSLAVTRILFGLAMLFDIPDERGGASMEKRWGDPNSCHFPLLPFVQAIAMPYMAIVYAALWCGAVGIMLGYKFRISATMFSICYWYLFLIEKSYWNNHSYLFGLVAILLTCTEANCYWSIDAYLDPSKLKLTVPYWNYFVLKYQFFILYFMAGMKKGTAEWLTGFSVKNLSEHWVFEPFKLFLTVSQTDYLIVHWFVYMFDLTIAIWMMYSKTRHVAMIFCAMFHVMNSRLFSIGMFPWVCLATMPLFYPFDWPKILIRNIKISLANSKIGFCRRIYVVLNEKFDCELTSSDANFQHPQNDSVSAEPNKLLNEQQIDEISDVDEVFDDFKEDGDESALVTSTGVQENASKLNDCCDNSKRWTLYLIIFHVVTQAFLPYSHFLTKGYNNWTDGLYGYSWDMMVHTWDTHAIIVKVVDNNENTEFYVDPYILTPNNRWTRHGDMVYQYARCLKENLIKETKNVKHSSVNLSIYIDSWYSFNGRFIQRMFDPKVDMLKADWSPFKRITFLMPLLEEALGWRVKIEAMREHIHSWSNNTDVVFLADFPGYEQETFIPSELINVSLTVLNGEVVYEPRVKKFQNGYSYKLSDGRSIAVDSGAFHKILNVGDSPAYYMYTFYNLTQENTSDDFLTQPKFPVVTELYVRFNKMVLFSNLLLKNLVQSVFSLTNWT